MKKRDILILILIIIVALTIYFFNKNYWNKEIPEVGGPACSSFNLDNCPESCVVCPPCPECSSISCQEKEFCAEMGIDDNWYEQIKNNLKK
ncbi:MAG TPA: hypothetical protein PKL98_02735 [Candidatus Pacearchaeota archaeon]|nr:hypothetical protein [Candidatus Pacearchaeota archaeon]